MDKTEWEYWIRLDAWTLREAILLLEEKDPRNSNPPYSKFFYEVQQMAIRSNRAGKLKTIYGRPLMQCTIKISPNVSTPRPRIMMRLHETFGERQYNQQSPGEIVNNSAGTDGVFPLIFLDWAQEKGLSLKDPLLELLCNSSDNGYQPKQVSVKESSVDRERCGAIAQCLWELNPRNTISKIIEHSWIKRIGNGSQYTEKTLRKWIHDLDPRPEDERIGRPKKELSSKF